jgi:hypothetical protein
MVDNVLRSAVSVTGERLNSESHCNANEETGFVADDEADDSSDEAEEVGVTHDIRLVSSPEDIRMENVSFTETVASECEEYYTDSSYFSPIETTSDDGPLLHGDFSCNFRQFRNVQFHQWNFSIRHPNCYVIINDEGDVQASVISIENIIEDKYGSVFIVGHSYHNESAFFVHPCNSDEVLSIKSVSLPSAFSSKWPIQIIKTKAIVIPTIPDDDADDDTEESYAVFPLHMKNKHD